MTSGRNVLTATTAAVYSCEDIDSGGERGAECCISGQFSDSLQCIACDSNIYNCTTTGVTVATLPLKQGYWRVNLETQAVLECWEPSACNGGSADTSVNDYCADAYWRDKRQQQQSQQQQHADADDTTTTSGTATSTTSNSNANSNSNRSAKLEAILAKHLLIFLTMTFLIYSTVST
eukprot:2823-Heterococcus_DN1.PRE.1